MKYNLRLSELGFSLLLIGVPMGMYLNYILSFSFMSELLMVLAFILIFSSIRFSLVKINKMPLVFNIIYIFHFILILYSFYSGFYEYILMHFFIIFIQTLIYLLDLNKIDFDYFLRITLVLSSVLTILGFYYIFDGKVVGDEAWIIRNESENYTLEIFTISYGMVINFSTVIYYILSVKKNIFLNIFLFSFLLMDLYGVIFGYKRSPFFCLIVISIIWFVYSLRKIDNKNFLKLITFLPLFIFIFIFLFFEKFSSLFMNFYNGLLTLFGFSSVGDETGSSSFRVGLRQQAFEIINDFSIFNYFFGSGYMTLWLDNPILQSFLDLGFIGLFSYLFIVVLFPIKIYFYNLSDPKIILLFTYCLYALLTIMNSGHQYMSIKYIPVIILSFFIFYIKRNRFI